MSSFLVQGALLGLSAGFAPGPLLALVVSETVRNGTRAGLKVALAPLVTDLPIVAATLFLLARLSSFTTFLGVVSVGGAIFVFYLGWENLRMKEATLGRAMPSTGSFRKGVVVNALSPHPYLFWISVGGPITWRAWSAGPLPPVLFIAAFYCLLVGSKLALAVAVGRSRRFLTGRPYLFIMRALGLLLCLLAIILLRDGLALAGWW